MVNVLDFKLPPELVDPSWEPEYPGEPPIDWDAYWDAYWEEERRSCTTPPQGCEPPA
jgi:hypothetical protein